jgi:fused signal recognition particle receptor
VLAVHEALDVPVKFIGMGEKVTDLVEFEPTEFAREVLEG